LDSLELKEGKMNHFARRLALGGAAALFASVLTAGAAQAAKPVAHACVGQTFSQAAHGPGPLGQIIKEFAQDPETLHPGLGDGIQALQAGQVSDDVAANTCNDTP
jgi:hypothetical protein